MLKVIYVFGVSFILNFIWENAHVVLYSSYHGEEITEQILFIAALGDALRITIILLPVLFFGLFRYHKLLSIIPPLLLAVAMEFVAIHNGNWSYNSLMPIIPILGVGLSPIIQLPLTTYITSWFVLWRKKSVERV